MDRGNVTGCGNVAIGHNAMYWYEQARGSDDRDYCGRDGNAVDGHCRCIGCGAPRRRVPAEANVWPGQMYPTWRVSPRYFYG